jgi:hypothetical protein
MPNRQIVATCHVRFCIQTVYSVASSRRGKKKIIPGIEIFRLTLINHFLIGNSSLDYNLYSQGKKTRVRKTFTRKLPDM